MPANEAIRAKLRETPHKPGVYLMRDRFGTVIYVGKARDLKRRVSQYFHPSRRHGWDLKLKALIEAIQSFDIHVVKSEAEALLLEGKLIKEFRPRYNVSFRDDKNFLLIKVSLQDPIPRFQMVRLRQEDGAKYFGPFANSGAARRTMELLRKTFQLRGCSPLTPTEADHKHCLYGHIKVCTAPCAGEVSLDEYRQQVLNACNFLEGQKETMVDELQKEMLEASQKLDFEKAARLRDLIADIQATTQKDKRFLRVPYSLPPSIDPQKDLLELASALGLTTPPQRIEGFDISNISGTFAVASQVSFKNGRPDRSQYHRFRIKTVVGQDDFACMAETIQRRYSRLLRESQESGQNKLPDLILIDGGKGQLNAALTELERLGLKHLPAIGLAKEFEEIYLPGNPEPIRLPHTSGALKLLQRVRDESHRVANSYNAQLRLKKISESVLDEFPGIGKKRKASLLKKFGSVQKLRQSTPEELAQIPGITLPYAQSLLDWLKSRNS